MTSVGADIPELRPFHGDIGHPDHRRLLLLSYHFPPDNAAGSLRWRKLSWFAAERGWSLDVVTTDPARLAAPDWGSLADLPPTVRVYSARPVRDRAAWFERGMRGAVGAARVGRGAPAAGRSSQLPPVSGAVSRRDVHWMPRGPRDLVRAYSAWRYFTLNRAWADAAAAVGLRVLEASRHSAVITCGPPHMVHAVGARLARLDRKSVV